MQQNQTIQEAEDIPFSFAQPKWKTPDEISSKEKRKISSFNSTIRKPQTWISPQFLRENKDPENQLQEIGQNHIKNRTRNYPQIENLIKYQYPEGKKSIKPRNQKEERKKTNKKKTKKTTKRNSGNIN